ncbi:hypothetical protein BDZ94DRAFT_1251895 [Collybia nuda]|uniref:COX assembly mitochondrial protein n=1 Tax=Collybia nuda TaxID=64659 RepID=A0A9P5YBW1_9AGAR|nr:hypothetical protein BDZ94DRAFT_1251895 [Collybia nuda]
MHPQLSDKKFVCKEFIQALEECHLSGWARLTGGCNTPKDQLNKCLRSERQTRSTANRDTARQRRVKAEQAWKEFNEI